MNITRGDHVQATTASGETITMRALGSPEPGYTFEVLWVATEDEWDRAEAAGTEPDGLPWPTDAIRQAASA